MCKKITLEETQKFFSELGLAILEETESKGVEYEYKCADKEGYLYSRSLRSVKHQLKHNKTEYTHTFSTKNKFFYCNLLHYIELNVDNGTTLLSEEKDICNIDQKLRFKCGECGREFSSTWHTFVHKQDKCCPFCFNRKRSAGEVKGNHKDSNIFHEKAREKGIIILDGPQIRYHDKVMIQDKDGYKGMVSASRILSESYFDRFSVKNPFSIDNLRVYAFLNNWDCVIYNQEYKGDKGKIKMMCSCGNDFEVSTTHFLEGKFQCNECRVKQSFIAKTVQNYLENKQIDFVKEKTFNGCKHIKVLPFDFYLTKYNACIEVDGIGHYRPVAFNGNKEQAKSIYEQRVINDKIKTEFCEVNKIPLLRLPFWIIEQNEYSEPIDNFIFSIESNDFNK